MCSFSLRRPLLRYRLDWKWCQIEFNFWAVCSSPMSWWFCWLSVEGSQFPHLFTPKCAVSASAVHCLPTTWTVIYVRLKGNPNFQFSYWAQWSYILVLVFWPILSSTIRRQGPSYTNAMFYLSLGEQEIKIFIWGKVLLCSFFYIVNLNLYSFGPHPVGDYGCQMGQSFRVNHFEWELRVGRRPR